MSAHITIRFQGNDYLLIGGAIATKEQYENGECSYAHLYDDGRIMRFGQQIGTKDEIEIVGTNEATPTPAGVIRILTGEGWPV